MGDGQGGTGDDTVEDKQSKAVAHNPARHGIVAAAAASAGSATGTADSGASSSSSSSSSVPPKPAEEEKEEEEEEDGEDTHYVGFEGDWSRVVVIDKKATVQRWFLGSAEADRRYDEVWSACQLTPICTVLVAVSIVGTIVAYTCFVRDKRLFLIPGIAGVGYWYNMLTSRSPRVLRILATDFGEWGVCGQEYGLVLPSDSISNDSEPPG